MGVVLAGLGALVFGAHVRHGSLYYDDWYLSADTHYHGYWAVVRATLEVNPRRPLGALQLPLLHAVFGMHVHVALAVAAGLRCLMAWCVFLLVRTLGVELLPAAAMAVLALLFPFSDSNWLYSTGTQPTLAVVLYLLGATVALRGMRASGRRSRALHAGALALYAASIVLYEIAAVAVALSGLLYVGVGSVSKASRRWALDASVAIGLVLLITSRLVALVPGHDVHRVQAASGQLSHAGTILHQSLLLLGSSVVPWAGGRTVGLLALAAVVVTALVVIRMLPAGDDTRRQLTRWLVAAGAGLVFVEAGYFSLIPSESYYVPLQAGVGNRINALATVGYAVTLVSAAMIVGTLAARGLRRGRLTAAGVSLVLLVLPAVGYVQRVRSDVRKWNRAAVAQSIVRHRLHRVLPAPGRRSTVVLFGSPGFIADGIPIFGASYDFEGAARLLWHDPSISGVNVLRGTHLNCTPTGIRASGVGASGAFPYDRLVFVDLPSGQTSPVRSRDSCERLVARFPPGPLVGDVGYR